MQDSCRVNRLQGNPGSDGPPGRDGSAGIKVGRICRPGFTNCNDHGVV